MSSAAATSSRPHDDIVGMVREILGDVLSLGEDRLLEMDAHTPLFGSLPELDSMAVAGVLTEIEDRCDILIDDDEVDGEMFETLGSLAAFVRQKMER